MKINIEQFLNNETDLNHKDVVVIESEGIWQESNFKNEDGTPQREFRVNLTLASGDIRNTSLRWSNVKLLVSAFGTETKDWVGKKVRAWKTKSEKAKSGFVFVFTPTDWERDDTGSWIIPEKDKKPTNDGSEDFVEYPENNGEEIPF